MFRKSNFLYLCGNIEGILLFYSSFAIENTRRELTLKCTPDAYLLTGDLPISCWPKSSGNYKDLDKTQVKLFPNFTRHHLITHTYTTNFCNLIGLEHWYFSLI